jgi:hypothetical protein
MQRLRRVFGNLQKDRGTNPNVSVETNTVGSTGQVFSSDGATSGSRAMKSSVHPLHFFTHLITKGDDLGFQTAIVKIHFESSPFYFFTDRLTILLTVRQSATIPLANIE